MSGWHKTLPNSTADAHYTVNYSGGSEEFTVNISSGGGTWIYLGTFPLSQDTATQSPIVTLTNETDGTPGTIVTADASENRRRNGEHRPLPHAAPTSITTPPPPIEPDCDESENAGRRGTERAREDDTESADRNRGGK